MPTALIPFPSFDPVLISIGPFAVRWYALAYICGILFGWLYARALIANDRLWGGPAPFTVADFDDFILWVTLGIILGGRIGYILFYNLPHFLEHPMEMLEVWKGGMSFHGGFLGCVVAVMWFASRNRIPILSLGDITTAVGPIGLFLGRLANFINGELWGRATDASLPWAMIFPNDPTHLPRHPSQLYEASLEGLGLLIILALFIRAGALKRPGLILGLFAMFYAVFRSFCEFFREPDPQLGYFLGVISMGQILSLLMVVAGLLLFLILSRKNPKSPPPTR